MNNFADRITRTPRVHNTERGDEAVAQVAGLPSALAEIVRGAAGSSPHLADLVRREAEWLKSALTGAPEAAFEAVLSEPAAEEARALGRQLRQQKARVSLLAGLADLAGVWDLEEVTGALTRFADQVVDRALSSAISREIKRGKLPGQGEDDLATAGGLAVIAMGKMGAGELNYSSDIDLICLFDETRFKVDDYGEARTSFVRAVRAMCQTLSERTADGYVFRTDLRLRPDASVTPVAISMEAAERYYESFGRTWERAAFIKARICAGDIKAGNRFLRTLDPFIWRRHLDYAAIQDAQDMRLRIREHKGLHQAPSHLGHDLKLGKGGIREIEFFTQTRQIIAGGRDPDLRLPGTVPALHQLAAKGWVTEDEAETLSADYRAHREAEHRVQMVADQQTHTLPETEADFARLAALAGRDPTDYGREIEERLARVAKLTDVFFKPMGGETDKVPEARIEGASETTARWTGYAALRSRRANEIFKRVWPALQARLAKASRPDEALSGFDQFLKGLPAGVQLFSLFEANPQLLDLVVDIVDTAPGLGRYLAQNSAVFDAVIGGQFFADWPGRDTLEQSLRAALAEEQDYEKRLDRARIWAHEWHFRIGVHHLRGLIDAAQSGRQYADLGSAVVAGLLPSVLEQFSAKHGPQPGRGAAVVAMGSLGAERLNAASDLDLITIYDGAGVDQSEGPRPLATRTYYARLTQALVTALSAPTAEGRLYEVDMRLRPSGKQGPVATSLDAFRTYQTDEAWTWEHLALTRARPLAGDPDLCDAIEDFRCDLIASEGDAGKVLADVADMRARLAGAKPSTGLLDVRSGPGRLQDIELFAEAAALLSGVPTRHLGDQIEATRAVFRLLEDEVGMLSEAARLFWSVQAASRLVFAGKAADDIGSGATDFLLRETECASIEALQTRIAGTAAQVAELISRHIGSAGTKG
ncbi:MAG: glutamine-synthetase adenylyltransferase [Silicimonas sp.]|nr:glutamine-synthetase adenylyltransferase [Silicimonas sp.]